MTRLAAPFALALLAAACAQEAPVDVPGPIAMTEEAVGHYCQMIVLEHPGPKAQVHMAGSAEPVWFSQVRDAFVFDRLPEETAEVAAIYVHDMGAAETWEDPGNENWIAAHEAVYVIDSTRRGGMGAPEFVPFAEQAAAEGFVAVFGGRIVAYSEITDAMVLAPVEVDLEAHDGHGADGSQGPGADG